ncbi:M1 family metallopeptidase [Streptomyces jumonjinensis]|uniref:M1 family metallopeptidase n=1 Tax=Streptomyces jumonjinensis TaxID=1945 RepID=UPI0037AD2E45
MRRSIPLSVLSPAVAVALLAGCSDGGRGDVRGAAGGAGLGDRLFPRLGNGGYDVLHYQLTLDYDPGTRLLAGTAEIVARATDDLRSFHLDLHRLSADEVTVDGERAAAGVTGDELSVRPREGLTAGSTFRTVVRYSGTPRTVIDADGSKEGWLPDRAGALAVGEPAGSMAWFPGNHHPSDKATFDLAVTVPKGLKAVSNGEPARETTTAAKSTFVWRTAEPMATYLATVAIGAYELTSSRPAGGPPVVTAVHPSVPPAKRRPLDRIPEFLRWSQKVFGPYPFSSIGAIAVPDGAVDYALETQNRPVLPAGQLNPETLVHEIAHQWFGNSVTPESWRDMWLNEGFATYAEWMWAEEFAGTPVSESFAEAFAEKDNWAFPPAAPPSAARISDAPVYGRGAMVLHQVRQTVGERAFSALLRGWAREHRHGNASTGDFTAYAERVSGRELSGVWKTWLYGEGRPPRP